MTSTQPVVVPRWLQLVAVPLAALALYAVAKAAGVVVLLFLTAAVIALILNPVVALVQRVRVPRGLAILVVYLGFFVVLGAAPPVLVALFQDPLTGVWVALLFVGLQQIEGHVVAPLVFGHALRINPLLVIFALLFGGELYGILGALVALPIAAALRETVVYLRQHLVLEPWGTMSPLAVPAPRPHPPADRPCPDCRPPVPARHPHFR